jgi:hypothetical protein
LNGICCIWLRLPAYDAYYNASMSIDALDDCVDTHMAAVDRWCGHHLTSAYHEAKCRYADRAHLNLFCTIDNSEMDLLLNRVGS